MLFEELAVSIAYGFLLGWPGRLGAGIPRAFLFGKVETSEPVVVESNQRRK
jgi:hypothetical protein